MTLDDLTLYARDDEMDEFGDTGGYGEAEVERGGSGRRSSRSKCKAECRWLRQRWESGITV